MLTENGVAAYAKTLSDPELRFVMGAVQNAATAMAVALTALDAMQCPAATNAATSGRYDMNTVMLALLAEYNRRDKAGEWEA